jgi:hypothetical protein
MRNENAGKVCFQRSLMGESGMVFAFALITKIPPVRRCKCAPSHSKNLSLLNIFSRTGGLVLLIQSLPILTIF